MITTRRPLKLLSAVLLLLLLFGLPSLLYPFGRDQGIHAQVGAAWLDGDFPYRDVWHPKGFLAFIPHALATAVFGHHMWGIRIVDLLWQFWAGLLIFLIGRRRMSERGALLAVGIYYLVYYAFGYWHVAQPEGFLSPVLLLAVWLYDGAGKSKRPLLTHFLCGFTIALAPWFKQTAVVFIFGLLAWALYDYQRQKRGSQPQVPAASSIRPLLLLAAGIALANGLVLAYTAVTGMLDPMLTAFSYAFFDYPDIDPTGWLELIRLTGAWGISYPVLIFPFLAGVGYIYFNRPLWPQWLGITLMALVGLAGIYIQRQLWLYHWVSTLPYLILIGAYTLETTVTYLQTLVDRKQKSVYWLVAFLFVSLGLAPFSRHLDYTIDAVTFLTGQTTPEAYLEGYDLLEVFETADYIVDHTARNEPIFIWGHYAMIYYLTDRPNPTRFINDPPLSLPHDRQRVWQREVAADLTADPPAYIIVATDDVTGFEPRDSKEQLPVFPALVDLLDDQYHLETTIGTFELYELQG